MFFSIKRGNDWSISFYKASISSRFIAVLPCVNDKRSIVVIRHFLQYCLLPSPRYKKSEYRPASGDQSPIGTSLGVSWHIGVSRWCCILPVIFTSSIIILILQLAPCRKRASAKWRTYVVRAVCIWYANMERCRRRGQTWYTTVRPVVERLRDWK